MSSISYKLNFEWLCKSLHLGELLSSPLHADWKMVLESGFSGMLGWLEYSL